MSLSDQLQKASAQLKSVDFWLFVVSFIVSGFTLQGLGSISRQAIALLVILTVGVAISIASKIRKNWTRKDTGWKGVLYAVGALLFVGYAICSFSLTFVTRREIDLSGSFMEQALAALSDPMTFGGLMPFAFLGIYSAAASLGLTDLPESVYRD
jgi:membrane protease YdiL (CAAX protease family)